jgi:hypothetical protein
VVKSGEMANQHGGESKCIVLTLTQVFRFLHSAHIAISDGPTQAHICDGFDVSRTVSQKKSMIALYDRSSIQWTLILHTK